MNHYCWEGSCIPVYSIFPWYKRNDAHLKTFPSESRPIRTLSVRENTKHFGNFLEYGVRIRSETDKVIRRSGSFKYRDKSMSDFSVYHVWTRTWAIRPESLEPKPKTSVMGLRTPIDHSKRVFRKRNRISYLRSFV